MDINSITGLVDSYSIVIVALVLGLTQIVKQFLGEQLAGKWSPVVSVVLGLGCGLLIIGATRQAAIVGIILGLTAGGLWSGTKAMAGK